MSDADLGCFVEARRCALGLWRAKQSVWSTCQGRFRKRSRTRLAIEKLCWRDPTSAIRLLLDQAACRYADARGDDVFRCVVDGVALPAVTAWYYPMPWEAELRPRTLTNSFTTEECLNLEELGRRACSFIESAWRVPGINKARLETEARAWHRLFANAGGLVHACSPVFVARQLLLSDARIPAPVVCEIVSYCE